MHEPSQQRMLRILQAPEVMEGDAATGASDVYGFGMVSSRAWQAVAIAVRTEERQGSVNALPAFGACTRVAAPVQRLKVRLVCPAQVLYEVLTWRLPWNFAQMSPFKVGR